MVRALEVHCNFLTCGCPICFPTYKDFTLCMSTVWGRRLRNRFGENARTHAFVMERGMRVQGHRDIVFSIINYIASDDGTHRRKMNATADAANATTVTTRCGICSMGWLSHQTTSRDHTEHTHTHTPDGYACPHSNSNNSTLSQSDVLPAILRIDCKTLFPAATLSSAIIQHKRHSRVDVGMWE